MNKVTLNCKYCKQDFIVAYKFRNRKFCTNECVHKFQTGPGNGAYGKVFRTKETHPEWAQRISQTCIDEQVNVGEKNGMKKLEVRKRMGATRKQLMKDNPEMAKEIGLRTAKDWAEGKYKNARVGQCKWYDVVYEGITYKVQGTWERDFLLWSLDKKINIEVHPKSFKYTDESGAIRSYFPDFYVHDWKCYVDTKNPYYEKIHATKISEVRRDNPNIEFRIIGKEFMTINNILKYAEEKK